MTGRSRSRLALFAGLVALMVATACGSDNDSRSSGDTTGGATAATKEAPITATLNASGATFPKAFYEVVIAGYKNVQPGVTVNYAGGGSGTGRQQLQDGVVDFAGSDGLVAEADKPKYKGEFVYVPTVAAPITVSYNLPDVKDVTLDAD